MDTLRSTIAKGLLVVGVLGLGACSNLTPREQGTAVGAGVGAVGGAVLSGGSAAGTLGGAAVGGLIGNQVSKDK